MCVNNDLRWDSNGSGKLHDDISFDEVEVGGDPEDELTIEEEAGD
jgi:hypothetical protein